MPATQIVLRVFVASPSDVADERAILDEVVAELNRTWSQTLGVRLEVLKWETHSFPNAGLDVQSTVSSQIGDNYDVFIGIMWTRFGTPTSNFASGTEEEFRRAMERYRADPNTLHIMFYFKNAAIPPDMIDVEQLGRVQSFRASLGYEGTYHWTFRTTQDLEGFLRVHLARIVQKHSTFTPPSADRDMRPAILRDPQSATPDLGILDHVELIEERLGVAGASLGRISQAMTDCGAAMQLRAAEMNAANARGSVQMADIKRFAAKTAEDLDLFVKRAEIEIPLFRDGYSDAMNHITATVNLWSHDVDQSLAQSQVLRASVKVAHDLLEFYISQLVDLQQRITNFPRVNVVLNKARRRTLQTLDRLGDATRFALQATSGTLALLDGATSDVVA